MATVDPPTVLGIRRTAAASNLKQTCMAQRPCHVEYRKDRRARARRSFALFEHCKKIAIPRLDQFSVTSNEVPA